MCGDCKVDLLQSVVMALVTCRGHLALYSADADQQKFLEGSDEQQISNTLFLRSLEEIFSASLIALSSN